MTFEVGPIVKLRRMGSPDWTTVRVLKVVVDLYSAQPGLLRDGEWTDFADQRPFTFSARTHEVDVVEIDGVVMSEQVRIAAEDHTK